MDALQHAITDAGRRLSDAVTIARACGGTGRWIAARLSDGGTDGAIYDTKRDAVGHQLHETQCAYLMVPPAGMPPAEATAWLDLHRRMYGAGMRLSDPDAPTAAAALTPNRADRRRAAAMRRHPSARRI